MLPSRCRANGSRSLWSSHLTRRTSDAGNCADLTGPTAFERGRTQDERHARNGDAR